MKKLGLSATRGEGWRAANLICGHTLDRCQGRVDEEEEEEEREERGEANGVIQEEEWWPRWRQRMTAHEVETSGSDDRV